MSSNMDPYFLKQIQERKRKLTDAVQISGQANELKRLLQEVDSAIERMENGSYGLCEECHDPIEQDRLMANPLERFCLDHLTAEQQHAFEEDLKLASQIQNALLPPKDLRISGWEISYYYKPLGPVSGDYCDIVHSQEQKDEMHFIIGDVSGKGVSASMLMSNLHAIFHSIIDAGHPIDVLMSRANRIFCESTMPEFYATLLCGRAHNSGAIEICNAGHCIPLLASGNEVTKLDVTGLPLGAFCSAQYSIKKIKMSAGDMLFLYTDGLSEAQDDTQTEYGIDRIVTMLKKNNKNPLPILLKNSLQDLHSFTRHAPPTDDLTIMVIKKI
jgi:phosphoserine phosphatase RsbU/P